MNKPKQKLIFLSASLDYTSILEKYFKDGWSISMITGSCSNSGYTDHSSTCWVLLTKMDTEEPEMIIE